MDAFANNRIEAIRIKYDFLRQGKCVVFVSTEAVIARALVKKASKLSKPDNSPVRICAYYGNMDGNIVIAITNIATPVHVEALAQMIYRICRENIRAKLKSTQSNNLPTVIKKHCEWNNNTISYKIDSSPPIITFIEVKQQKCLSVRYFIEKLCSLIVRNCKRVHNEIRVEALVIKNTDFNTVATFQNLSPEEAEVLKFD
ncbi:10542_t:CDS:2 [Funneliformis geosporum]|uniref:10542_t:CDS:1 n=1 Tax=Funneliformis geosporum TaxID=1117311 RepID=A0A9W4SNU4_9GLOM|nr:10542_t:CDS:2 [Funneliformis geosporum]